MATKASVYKAKKDHYPDTKSKRDANMESLRILQRNLVFVSGLPSSIAQADVLKSTEYFGRYGKVAKVVTNQQQPFKKPYSYQAYVTYPSSLQAAIAITALDGFNFDDRTLKVSFGTTKYCSHFLKGYDCLNTDCFYLHEFDRKNQVFNKDTRTIFEEQNEEALDIVYQNLNCIVKRIVDEGEQVPDNGFPSLMEMMEFLVESQDIQSFELESLLNKHRRQKEQKLQTPTVLKPGSPKQSVKLTKSNSFSTLASPSKSEQQQIIIPYSKQTQKKCIPKSQQKQKQILKQLGKQKQIDRSTSIRLSIPVQQQTTQNIQTSISAENGEFKYRRAELDRLEKHGTQDMSEEVIRRYQQVEISIEKQFLKNIMKLTEKSKSKMQFSGQPKWQEVQKIQKIIHRCLFASD